MASGGDGVVFVVGLGMADDVKAHRFLCLFENKECQERGQIKRGFNAERIHMYSYCSTWNFGMGFVFLRESIRLQIIFQRFADLQPLLATPNLCVINSLLTFSGASLVLKLLIL
jgi:hypothetical protein